MEGKRGSRDRSSSSSSSSSSGSGSESESSGPASPASPAPGAGSDAASAGASTGNAFANDGSFMELFKKKMEEERRRKEQQQQQKQQQEAEHEKKPVNATSFVGKRRGGAKLALKTGMVAKKQKLESEGEAGKGDAWSKYMAEVKKYKAHQCGDDDKTRPLVK